MSALEDKMTPLRSSFEAEFNNVISLFNDIWIMIDSYDRIPTRLELAKNSHQFLCICRVEPCRWLFENVQESRQFGADL